MHSLKLLDRARPNVRLKFVLSTTKELDPHTSLEILSPLNARLQIGGWPWFHSVVVDSTIRRPKVSDYCGYRCVVRMLRASETSWRQGVFLITWTRIASLQLRNVFATSGRPTGRYARITSCSCSGVACIQGVYLLYVAYQQEAVCGRRSKEAGEGGRGELYPLL